MVTASRMCACVYAHILGGKEIRGQEKMIQDKNSMELCITSSLMFD